MKQLYKQAWRLARLQYPYGYAVKGQSSVEKLAYKHLKDRKKRDPYESGLHFSKTPAGNVVQWGGVRHVYGKIDEIPF